MLVKVAFYASRAALFWPNYAKNYAPFSKLCSFFKSCSSKTMANKSKNTFSLIRSRIFLSAIIYILFRVCLYCGFSCVAIVAGSGPSFL